LIACRSCGVRTIVWPCRIANFIESAIPTASPNRTTKPRSPQLAFFVRAAALNAAACFLLMPLTS
jgi:hypothetical protein